MSEELTYMQRCEERARSSRHRAWLQKDGSILVHSNSDPARTYRVTYEAVGDVIRFRCPCEAGEHRRELVCCWHAAKAALRLEREGIAEKRGALWRVPARLFSAQP